MGIKCGKEHIHDTIQKVRACYGIDPNMPGVRDENLIPKGPKPAGPHAKRNAQRMEEQKANTRLAFQGKPHLFTSGCPGCVAGTPHEGRGNGGSIAVEAERSANTRPNRYGGTCGKCKGYVKAEAGMLTGSKTFGYGVQHFPGQCVQDVPESEVPMGKVKLPDVPAGHYAIQSLTGNNDLDFFRVDKTDRGKTFIKRIIGGKPDANIRFSQYLSVLEAIVKAGTEKAALLYGQTIGSCSKCNRSLTDEESRRYGRGPDCRAKYGLG